VLGQSFIKVLEWRGPECIFARNPDADMTPDLAVEPGPEQDSSGGGDLEMNRFLVESLGLWFQGAD
jgi:hypothetical protein